MDQERLAEMLELNKRVQEAVDRAIREARLEHARAGRSVPESRDGKVVWISPEEVFGQCGITG